MKISLNWIQDFVQIPETISPEDLGKKLTLHTAEVEEVIDQKKSYDNMVLGRVLSKQKHPNADRLNLVQVDIGTGSPVQIVCGGQNIVENMLVAVALPGSKALFHGEELVEIKESKIRGENSYGMICAGEEIGLEADNHEGQTEIHIKDLSHLNGKPGQALAELLSKTDIVLDIDNKSLTHRPDLWGHYGLAREFSAIFQMPLKTLGESISIQKNSADVKVNIQIENPEICSRFSSAVLTGVKVEASPKWLQDRLLTAGMNPHNNIVDVTNYVMLELGQPMHAYDRKILGSDGFIVRKAKKGEKLLALDEKEYELHAEDPLVCDEKNVPVGIAGIKGGFKSGISTDTTEIILEAAHFDAAVVRKASQRNALRTDASQRFEKKLDPSQTETAILRAIHLIQKLCPNAKLISEVQTVGTWQPSNPLIQLRPSSVRSKLGISIETDRMIEILESLAFRVNPVSEDLLEVSVPSHRATGDVSLEEDLVEEIGRLNGYDQIPEQLPKLPISLPMENRGRALKHHLRKLLAYGFGFTEVLNYSFYGKDLMEACLIKEEGHLKVQNPLSEDQTHMRSTMTPNMLATIAKNAREFDKMKCFEIGHTYKETGDYMPLEEKRINVCLASTEETEIFYELKGVLESLVKKLNFPGFKLKPSEKSPSYAHPKKCMDIQVAGKSTGVFFTVHPKVLKNLDVKHQVVIFALNLSELEGLNASTGKFKEPAKFPGIPFDISVLVDKSETVANLESAIRSADKDGLIETTELFDIYEGKNLPEGSKSLSFSILLRHPERTLTEQEFRTLQEGVFIALESKGAKIRGR